MIASSLALLYVAAVLLADTAATWSRDWGLFHWQIGSFDLFKLGAWLVVPFLWSLSNLDRDYFGLSRWSGRDWAIGAGLIGLCAGAVCLLPHFPGLRDIYPSRAGLPAAAKARFVAQQLAWTMSWIVGWEFLHRYFLLRHAEALSPRHGWWCVPIFEGTYHLQKPWPEMLGMIALSLVLTLWTKRRRALLLPFLVHLAIELTLIAFLIAG